MNDDMNRSNALVEQHLALVGYNVNEVLARVPSHVSRADLTSAGAMALVRAARSFDDSKGVPFARYASMRIRGALIDELRSMDWVPRGARRRARRRPRKALRRKGPRARWRRRATPASPH